ncbi:hypothetical protein D6D02_10341 [Aureobasidium pullulans]|nr:hypothetical protein D6D24_09130 [Aureobasidium pullulans]THW61278.1 hypothetical protein D6D20_05167 [Aureobasidium pullulans]THX92273.1 hypothetical protein D6D03_10521 [Aureobasidium pullulans]THX93198.1 hypothetical protein D6D02_10341 [Aureobasidium pullulans]THY98528.1 hypothetical protein D6C92_02813 [Aureobasidium pullulans]
MSSFANPAINMNHIIAKAEALHLERQILALQALYPTQGYTVKRVAGSTTILSPAMLGRKLNHTYGFALEGEVTMDDLHAIEAAYKQNGVHPEIDMCDYAHGSAFDLLSAQYTVTGSLCEYQQSLSGFQGPDILRGDMNISILGPEDHNTFIQASVDGFSSTGRAPELLEVLAESAAARSDTILFSASLDGELVGTAAMAMIDVEDIKVVVFFIDSCLPNARGKSVHKALLLERLRVARDRGCDVAVATAREGSISGRNIEKVGFRRAYSCKTYTKNQ